MKSIFLVIPVLIFLFSCKKEKSTETNSSGGSATQAGVAIAYHTLPHNGMLECAKHRLFQFSNDSLVETSAEMLNAMAMFSTSLLTDKEGILNGTDVDAGNVKVNNIQLKLSGTPKSYSDTTFNLQFHLQNWSATGSANVAAINYTNNDSFPVYTGYTIIPDTVYKSKGFKMSLTGLSGCDEVRLIFSRPFGTISKVFDGTSTAVAIPSSELTPLTNGSVSFSLSFSKDNYQSFGGKTFKFKSSRVFQVSGIVLVP